MYTGLVNYMRQLYQRYGYDEILTPQIFDKKLFETSGHLPNYRQNMYMAVTPDVLDATKLRRQESRRGHARNEFTGDRMADCAHGTHDGDLDLERLATKPDELPVALLGLQAPRRSYRELPFRIADFVAFIATSEAAGAPAHEKLCARRRAHLLYARTDAG